MVWFINKSNAVAHFLLPGEGGQEEKLQEKTGFALSLTYAFPQTRLLVLRLLWLLERAANVGLCISLWGSAGKRWRHFASVCPPRSKRYDWNVNEVELEHTAPLPLPRCSIRQPSSQL